MPLRKRLIGLQRVFICLLIVGLIGLPNLALAQDGTLYVGDQLGIHQFDASGKYVKTLMKTGPDSGLRTGT